MKQKPYIQMAIRLFQMRKYGREYPKWFWDLQRQYLKMLLWGKENEEESD
jgi:hypothetical protein